MRQKQTFKKAFAYSIFLLVVYTLQITMLARIRIEDVSALIIPLAVVGAGLYEGGLWGGLFGLAAGVFCDIAVDNSSFLFTVYLPILGFFIGFLSEYYLAKGFPSYLMCCLGTLALTIFLQFFKFWVFDDVPLRYLWKTAVIQTAYSAIFIIPIYYAVRRLARMPRG